MPKHDEPAVTKMFTMRLYWVRTISAEHRNQEDEVELRESSVAVKISSFPPQRKKFGNSHRSRARKATFAYFSISR